MHCDLATHGKLNNTCPYWRHELYDRDLELAVVERPVPVRQRTIVDMHDQWLIRLRRLIQQQGRLDLEIQRLFELRGPDGFDGENASHLDRVLEVQHGVELQLQAMAPAFEEDG
ncbi:hypothetical protein Ptr902_07793 [Pyrenophora tritici-repentis]|nr:hypothetical protein Ptr902_07793 [Pyrenophora tritici-repentis]